MSVPTEVEEGVFQRQKGTSEKPDMPASQKAIIWCMLELPESRLLALDAILLLIEWKYGDVLTMPDMSVWGKFPEDASIKGQTKGTKAPYVESLRTDHKA
jgi:hypothetical protein